MVKYCIYWYIPEYVLYIPVYTSIYLGDRQVFGWPIGKFLDGLDGQESYHLLKIIQNIVYLFVLVCTSLLDLKCVFSIG